MTQYFELLLVLFLIVGLFVILTNNPVHSILGLVLVFFLGSCFSISLGVEFLAILILIVYVGAISVLFLFVVMLLNIRVIELNVSLVKYWWLGVAYSLFFLVNLYYALSPTFFVSSEEGPSYLDFSLQLAEWGVISQLGEMLFLYFPHLIIFSGFVLFLAIVSPVVLSFVKFSGKGAQSFTIQVRRQDIFLQTVRLSVDKNYL